MQHIDIRKKRPSRWPWLLGLVVLGLIIWGVTILLTAEEEETPDVAVPTVQDTQPPAALPDPPYERYVDEPGRPLAELAPLNDEDAGEAVRVEGVVVATGNEAFWLLAGEEVIRVDSYRQAHTGDTLRISGTLTPADPEQTERMAEVIERQSGSQSWSLVRSLKVVEDQADTAGSAPIDGAR